MPAKSENQRVAAAIALSAKRGETPKSKLRGASKQMAKGMNESQLHDFAKKSACRTMLNEWIKRAGGPTLEAQGEALEKNVTPNLRAALGIPHAQATIPPTVVGKNVLGQPLSPNTSAVPRMQQLLQQMHREEHGPRPAVAMDSFQLAGNKPAAPALSAGSLNQQQ